MRSTPHIDRLRARRVLSPVKAAAHSRQDCCSVCLSARRPHSCALPLSLTISRKSEALPGARSSGPGRSLSMRCTFSPARWDPVHERPSPLCPRLRCCTRWICRSKPPSRVLLSRFATSHPSIHDISTLAWSVSSSACFSFGEGVSDLLGAGPACYDGPVRLHHESESLK